MTQSLGQAKEAGATVTPAGDTKQFGRTAPPDRSAGADPSRVAQYYAG